MADLINDGSLIGFWPLNEPSGTPFFKNYSPATAKYPSGISFDMHVAVADVQNREEVNSVWPGTTSFVNAESGNLISGYSVPGSWKIGVDSSPRSKYLVLGGGARPQAEQCLGPSVANSGFTAGLWVYPSTNGYLAAHEEASALSAANDWNTAYARAHTLLGHFSSYTENGGWMMGVSGSLDRGAQHDLDAGAGNTLGAYVSMTKGNNSAHDVFIDTPIESGRYTHLTMSYRYVGGANNEMVLYKDGRVVGSGTTSDSITLANGELMAASNHRALTIGGSDIATDNRFAHHYDGTSGWGNLVSGVYHFRRVLDEGEILEMHERGGLVADESVLCPSQEVVLTDPDLAAYYPHLEPAFADASKNHRPLISNFDMGRELAGAMILAGPHDYGCVYNDGNVDLIAHASTSGLCYDALSQGSWTIGFQASTPNLGLRAQFTLLSWGSVTDITNGTSLPASSPTTDPTAGICHTVSGATGQQMHTIEVYSTGDVTDTDNILVFNIDGMKEYYDNAMCHIALAYDDSTKGVAVYLNGVQQGSGTLTHSLTDQLMRVTGSGYPLLFGNGVKDELTDSLSTAVNRGVHTVGGQDSCLGPMFVAKRALLPAEIRGIAENGIDITQTYKSMQDPRCVGYWPASDFSIGDIIVPDEACCWGESPGNLVRGESLYKHTYWYSKEIANNSIYRNDGTARYNQFGTRTLPPELSGYGNLGITSGTFSVRGGSPGTAVVVDANHARSAIANYSSRYKPTYAQRDNTCQNIAGEFVLSYEVTPSGDIPATLLGMSSTATSPTFNSLLHTYNIEGFNGSRSYLTTIEAGSGSGVSLVWRGESNTPLVSGNISYGVPSRVLLHGKFDTPYVFNGLANGTAPYSVSMWINGELVHRRQLTATTANLWSAGNQESTADISVITFGGLYSSSSLYSTQFSTKDTGLGDIYMRNMFIMRGKFFTDEIAALAASGIQSPTIPGFLNCQQTTQVTTANGGLVGYYRFNGFAGGGSGTTDLSPNANHLFGAQQSLTEGGSTNRLGAHYLRAFPGPFEESDLGIQCSGFTYSSKEPSASAGNLMPPFMASGVRFNAPADGFSVGFFYIRKTAQAASEFGACVAYGIMPISSFTTTTNKDYSWAIGQDSLQNMRMVMAVEDDYGNPGNLYFNPASVASHSGQVEAGSFGEGGDWREDARSWEQYRLGSQRMPRLDAWSHYCWTYEAATKEIVAYVNGDVVDRQALGDNRNLQLPSEFARYLTFYQHTSAPWADGNENTSDHEGSLTDFFYFDDTLTPAEVRYISQNGIDLASGDAVSGVIGGFVHGQDTGSGLMGGYHRGQDIGSGLLGGYIPGSTLCSGLAGGYVSGVEFTDGTIGGFVRGLDTVSGIMAGYIVGVEVGSGMMAGYIHGQEIGSGLFGGYIFGALDISFGSGSVGGYIHAANAGSGLLGGFILGGLQGSFQFDASFTLDVLSAKDFDAQLEIAKTAASDFDAKLIIFQNEAPPLVGILTPGATVNGQAPPFNQYFIGAASGQQGKTITQAKWNFGDLTPTVNASESGAGLYPTQHYFASSGFYTVKFEAIDSDGLHASATRVINAASGIDPVLISMSGVPRSGNTGIIVEFTNNIDILPPGVSVVASLLQFDDGQTTSAFNPTHSYTEPGTYRPVWIVRDSRGVIWSDTLEAGPDVS